MDTWRKHKLRRNETHGVGEAYLPRDDGTATRRPWENRTGHARVHLPTETYIWKMQLLEVTYPGINKNKNSRAPQGAAISERV